MSAWFVVDNADTEGRWSSTADEYRANKHQIINRYNANFFIDEWIQFYT